MHVIDYLEYQNTKPALCIMEKLEYERGCGFHFKTIWSCDSALESMDQFLDTFGYFYRLFFKY